MLEKCVAPADFRGDPRVPGLRLGCGSWARSPLHFFTLCRTRWEGSRGSRGWAGRMRTAPALCAMEAPTLGALPLPRGEPEAQVKERGRLAFPHQPPLRPCSPRPPPNNKQLVEDLHFMKIGWEDKGVSLCCSVTYLETVPTLKPVSGSGERGVPPLLFLAWGNPAGEWLG